MILLLALILHSQAFAGKLVTDSLVKNLDCNALTRANVLQFVDRTAFASGGHFPVRNWSSGVLGQCWSLAAAQRKFFYLVRLNQEGASLKASLKYSLEMIRGSKPQSCTESFSNQCSEDPVPLKIFSVADRSLEEGEFYQKLFSTFLNRFKAEIEYGQEKRFYNLGNFGLATASTEVSRDASKKVFSQIQKSFAQGGMPLLVLRPSTLVQHVVLVKQMEKISDKQTVLSVYDSNQPWDDQQIIFQDGLFFAPDILSGFGSQFANRPVDVLLRDEDEMEAIRATSFAYYKKVCASPQP